MTADAPDLASDVDTANQPLLVVDGLVKHFAVRGGLLLRNRGVVHAVDNVSLQIHPGETLGLVGESGCGKSTLGRAVLWLDPPNAGTVALHGQDLRACSRTEIRALRKQMQIVFQDPYESLNSRHTIGQILTEPFIIHQLGAAAERARWVSELLERVGLPSAARDKYPHEFSGGQRQRVGIARAIALNPKLIVCDEAVSALDVSVQAQILNLLLGLQRERGLAMLFIAHDLAVVKHVSDRIAVMYLGKIVETASSRTINATPRHPYTKALLSAIPVPDPTRARQRILLAGDVPSPIAPPPGCRFHTRCPHAVDRCRTEEPRLEIIDGGASVACHRWRELA